MCQEPMEDCKPLIAEFFPNVVATTQRPDKMDTPSSEISNPNEVTFTLQDGGGQAKNGMAPPLL